MPYYSGGNEDGYWSAVLGRILEEQEYDENKTDYYGAYEETAYGGYDEKKGKGSVPLDYSVLSIGILTLALILFVEIARHTIDHAAHGKPFFKAVLIMMYSELATLGIVEFAVFLLLKYYDNLDKEKKDVFGDVHFALFYTAIFNAFQSSVTAFFTTRQSDRLWVSTEQLELDHYVELREEYDRVEEMIEGIEAYTKIEKWIRNCVLFLQRPGLRGKYLKLRTQVRFHELRLHFIESNNLPLNLKVSDYLKRSEMGVLIGLVHVSATAWILLVGGLNLLYFCLGMVGYSTGEVEVVGTCMTGVFFGLLLFFIVFSLALRQKMEWIFQTIMKTKIIESSDREEGVEAQKNLFWLGSPHLVVSVIQFMNFGYAIALAVVIMYWPYLTGFVEPYWYLIAVFACYSLFLYNLSMLLPQFTLCTSLGYLTNQKQLQETVAKHRLEEVERQQRRRMIESAIENDSVIVLATKPHLAEPTATSSGSLTAVGTQKTVASVLRSSADGVIPLDNPKDVLLADLVRSDTTSLRNQLPEQSRESLVNRERRMSERRATRKKAVSDGVATMRAMSAPAGEAFAFTAQAAAQKMDRKIRMERRAANRRQQKSLSQPGVIKGWQDISQGGKNSAHSMDDADGTHAAQKENKHRRQKSNSESRVIQAWHESNKLAFSGNGAKASPSEKEGPKFVRKETEKPREDSTPQWKKDRAARLSARREARKKTQSESAIIQSWQDFSASDKSHESSSAASHPNENERLSVVSSDDGSEDYMIMKDGKTVSYRNRGDNDHYGVTFVGNQLDLHTVQETEREHELHTVRETEREHELPSDAQGKFQADSTNVVDLADAVIVEEPKKLPAPPSSASKAGTQTDEEYEDNKSVDTDKSMGNLSDVDVFETVRGITPKNFHETDEVWYSTILKHVNLESLILDAKQYFLGSQYPVASHIFGTMVVFFVIGHRIEAFIARSGVIVEPDNQWGFDLAKMFWAEVVWLSFFIIADLLLLALFPFWRCKDPREKTLNIAALMDFVLTGVVMVLLFVAEAQRCCKEDLDEPTADEAARRLAELIGLDYDFEDVCTCPGWGDRTFSGLGMIEPFTSLIVLRIFRFLFARLLVKEMANGKDKDRYDSNSTSDDTDKEHSSDPHSDHHGHGSHGHGHGHDGLNGATALELWERAVTEFPHIVEKYGYFSGELLQAMLGLQVDTHSSDVSAPSQTGSNENEALVEKEKSEHEEKPHTWKSHIKLTGTKYANLPAEAQGVIVAGRLGKPVKSMYDAHHEHVQGGQLSVVNEGSTRGLVEFEVDKEQMRIEQDTNYSFIAPFARLVRSMRRCDRRHLPLLKTWVSVDVVVTQFEIVYFEAADDNITAEDQEVRAHEGAVCSALKATRGGKGLRLCDVATGRKVVGHLDLADITEVHVEQDDEPVSDVLLLEKAAEHYHSKEDLAVEYWGDPIKYQSDADPKRFARNIRWTLMKEERLKITTLCGTLVFRFFSDLACTEIEKLENGPPRSSEFQKDVAFQWAETIVRICGPDQLKQSLPHFGEKNDDELRDYLQVVHFHSQEAEKERKKVERKGSDIENVNGERLAVTEHGDSQPRPKTLNRKLKSFGETEGSSEINTALQSRRSTLRRALSLGVNRTDDKEKQEESTGNEQGSSKDEMSSLV